MSGAREAVLGALRRSLKRGADGGAARAAVEGRLRAPARGPVPARARLDHGARLRLFEEMAVAQAATVARVADAAAVPGAVGAYLKGHNLAPRVRLAPDAELAAMPWQTHPLLKTATGVATADDETSVTCAFAGIAETGTLMLHSGPEGPSTLNFLPETHIVVLKASQVVGPYEDAWDRLRAVRGADGLPRTVNFITGPSRTADIEQTIQLGAHGPRRLHIVVVEDIAGDAPGDAP